MSQILSISDLVNLWPTRAALANDINQQSGGLRVSTAQVHKWAEKNSIVAKYHHAVLRAAQARGFDVTAEQIVALHDPWRESAA